MLTRYCNTSHYHVMDSDIEAEVKLPYGVYQKPSFAVCSYCREKRKGYYVVARNGLNRSFVCTVHIVKHTLEQRIEHVPEVKFTKTKQKFRRTMEYFRKVSIK
jgi:hypothetical protein